jgi:hypothetical protein
MGMRIENPITMGREGLWIFGHRNHQDAKRRRIRRISPASGEVVPILKRTAREKFLLPLYPGMEHQDYYTPD